MEIEEEYELDGGKNSIAKQIIDDLKSTGANGFNYYAYRQEALNRGNLPLLPNDAYKLFKGVHQSCKNCEWCRGDFGTKYLCLKPSHSEYMQENFVDKKELDNIDFCVDFKQSTNPKIHLKSIGFNEVFKGVWK